MSRYDTSSVRPRLVTTHSLLRSSHTRGRRGYGFAMLRKKPSFAKIPADSMYSSTSRSLGNSKTYLGARTSVPIARRGRSQTAHCGCWQPPPSLPDVPNAGARSPMGAMAAYAGRSARRCSGIGRRLASRRVGARGLGSTPAGEGTRRGAGERRRPERKAAAHGASARPPPSPNFAGPSAPGSPPASPPGRAALVARWWHFPVVHARIGRGRS